MTEHGRAALFFGSGKPFQIEEFPVPDPEPGAVLARLDYTSICGSDMHVWRGENAKLDEMAAAHGLLLGHETVGHVARLGDRDARDSLGQPLREGDPIVFTYFRSCGQCRRCRTGRPSCCDTALQSVSNIPAPPRYFVAAYADYFYLPPGHFIMKLPQSLDPVDVIGVNCAVAQACAAIDRASVVPGEHVVVQGAGGLGLYVIAAAKRAGAANIVAIDADQWRLEAATSLGADATVSLAGFPDSAARVAQVKELTDGGADVVVEVAGVSGVIQEGLAMLARGGRYIEMGQIVPGGDAVQLAGHIAVTRNITVSGVGLYPPPLLEQAVELVGAVRSNPYLTQLASGQRFGLEQIDEAFARAATSPERPVLDLRR
ncbi:zinc-binding dehydrogenase [Nocardia xishanensis]|uniref:Zinc-binding dehydrogenase n=1 Tax=Nocardia xishanensis TaxID=238964 RepID=A0ABW7XC47_9NOCA